MTKTLFGQVNFAWAFIRRTEIFTADGELEQRR